MKISCDGTSILYEGEKGPGLGKSIVLVSGDEEYRSEEALPMLAQILAKHHGFSCRMLFAINPETGEIDPTIQNNIPGLEHLDHADLMLLSIRFRQLPDDKMKHIVDFTKSGKPIVALRTTTHGFRYDEKSESIYKHFTSKSNNPKGGYGKLVLGETWAGHHGDHGNESTRGVLNEKNKSHPILKGFETIWGPSDVYTVCELPADAKVLVWGQVLTGMNPNDPLHPERNDPMMPLAWIRDYPCDPNSPDKTSKVFTTTAGAAVDLENAGLRRLLVNACYYGLGLEDQIPDKSDVTYVQAYKPTNFGMNQFKKGIKPADLV